MYSAFSSPSSFCPSFFMPKQRVEAGTRCGSYLLLRKIGEGASGSVFSAVNDATKMYVVVKFIPLTNSWFKAEFEREVVALSKLQGSPQVVKLVDSFRTSSYGVIVLERLTQDLLDFIEAGPLDAAEIRVIFRQVCRAVKTMHEACIAHLDIKPENIFLNDIFSVKLGDFGSCFEWTEDNPKKVGITGTSFYCAPEVKRKESYFPAEADIWSLGILLHVLFTGFWPYSATSEEQLSVFINEGRIQILQNKLPPGDDDLLCLLENMLQFSPEKRFTIDEVMSSTWMRQEDELFQASSDLTETNEEFSESSDGLVPILSTSDWVTRPSGGTQVQSSSQPDLQELNILCSPRYLPTQLSCTDLQDNSLVSAQGVRYPSQKGRRTSWSARNIFKKLSKLGKKKKKDSE